MNRAERVQDLFKHCLFIAEELPPSPPTNDPKETLKYLTDQGVKFIFVESVASKVLFNPDRIAESREEIRSILRDMDSKFMKQTPEDDKSGYSFLAMPFDKDGVHWCEQPTADLLVALGIACGFIEYLVPREAWPSLPGGVPYFVINIL